MNKNQELLLYYCHQLRSEWAQKKALAYLRILAEAQGDLLNEQENKEAKQNKTAAEQGSNRFPK